MKHATIIINGLSLGGAQCEMCGTVFYPTDTLLAHERWHSELYTKTNRWVPTAKEGSQRRHGGGRPRIKECVKKKTK